MKVNLRTAEPNPFRDLKVDPVDPANVAELAKSIKEHGFWGGMVAREHPKKPSVIQIIAGWHRREAALKAGIVEADIFVGPFSDLAAVRAYADENATQRGNTSTSLAGSIAAAVREILLRSLSTVEINSANLGGQKRDGVGREAITEELKGVHGINDNVVRIQLGILKAEGAYDRIVSEVIAQVEEDEAAATAAREAIAKLQAQPKHKVTFSTKVAEHLKVPSHVETFRKLAEKQGDFLPVAKQGALAKVLADKAEAKDRELTSSFIEEEFEAALIEPKFIQRIVSGNERAEMEAALKRSGWQNQMTVHMRNFSGSARSLLSVTQKMADLQGQRPKGVTLLATPEFRTAVDSLKAALRIVQGKLI